MVLLDFSRSGASEFYGFCTLVGHRYPHPFFSHFLFDFSSILGSTSRLKSMRLRIFLYIFFSYFLKAFLSKNRIFRVPENEHGGIRPHLWPPGKTPHSRKNIDSVWEWYTFLHMPFSRAVRKGVRGKVNLTP